MTLALPGFWLNIGQALFEHYNLAPIRGAPALPVLEFAPIIFSALNFIITKALIHCLL
jgi:hypothetical protein